MRRNKTLPTIVYVFSLIEWSAIFGQRHKYWTGEGPIPDSKIKEMQKELDTGFWTVKWGFYGPKDVIKAQYEEVKRVVSKAAPKGRLRNTLFAGGEEAQLLEAASVPQPYGGMFVGVPSMFSIRKCRSSAPQLFFFSFFFPIDCQKIHYWELVAVD